MFSKSPANRFEKIILRKDRTAEDSFNSSLPPSSPENLKKLLEERLKLGETSTISSENLINFSGGPTDPLILSKYSQTIYEKLKKTHKTQIVSLLGSSLKSKEFCKNSILSHIGNISSSDLNYLEAVQSACELLSIFSSDGENSHLGESVNVHFDANFTICGVEINSKLTDLDISKTCGIFRIIKTLSDASLQHLGLMHRALSEKNIELHQTFKNNLDLLGIPWIEVLDVMELLAVVLLAEEITMVTSFYTLAGQKPCNCYVPIANKSFGKICKLLGVLPARLSDFFSSFCKQQGMDKVKAFRKVVILLAFEGFLGKINVALVRKSRELRMGKGIYEVRILSFPSGKVKANIDGFVSNLISECFEFVSYEQYLSILSTFNEEKISASKSSVPRSRYIVELFLDKSFGILLNFCNQGFWKSLIEEISGDSVYNKIVSINDNLLTVNYSWGSQAYDLQALQYQFGLFPDKSFLELMKKCSNRIVGKTLDCFFNFDCRAYVNFVISEVLGEASGKNSFLVFCYKDVRDLVFESSLASIVNIPYKFLINKKLVNSEHLKKNGLKVQSSETYFFFDSTNKEPLKRIFTGKIPSYEISGVKIASDSQLRGPKLQEYIEPVNKPQKPITRCSSANLRPRIYSISSSKGSTKFLQSSFKNFKNFSFIDHIPDVIRIQSAWRGFKARKYFRSLFNLHKSAVIIQKYWKGFKVRSKINIKKTLICIRFIQKLYKRRFFIKNQAARVIQKYFLNKFQKFSYTSRSSKYLKSSKNDLKTTQRSLLRSQHSQKPEKKFTFVPSLSKKTVQIAESVNRRSYTNLKIEDRLLAKGREISEKREMAILDKRRNEIRLIPSASVKTFNSHFYEDNIKFLNGKKNSVKDLKIAKAQKEMAHCTFRPNIVKDKRPRSAMETVNDLYNWNVRKNTNIEKERREEEREQSMKMKNFKASEKSELIYKSKRKEEVNKAGMFRELKKNIEPYWPNK